MRGLPVRNDQYAGTSLEWLHPSSLLTGIGLVCGSALPGTDWLVLKSEGALRDWGYRRISWLAAAVVLALGLAFAVSLSVDVGAIAQSHLNDRP